MDGLKILEICSWPSINCWSRDYRCFVGRRDQVLMAAQRVLGSRKEAERWLDQPARGLSYGMPWRMLSTHAGYVRVMSFLMQIEYGVYV